MKRLTIIISLLLIILFLYGCTTAEKSAESQAEELAEQTKEEIRERFEKAAEEEAAKPPEYTSLAECEALTSALREEDCYRKVAEFLGDKSICPKITTDFVQSLCYKEVAYVTGDISICQMFEQQEGPTNSQTTHCYKGVAIYRKDAALCEDIKDNYVQADCYMEIAYRTNNPSLCSKVNPHILNIFTEVYYAEICE